MFCLCEAKLIEGLATFAAYRLDFSCRCLSIPPRRTGHCNQTQKQKLFHLVKAWEQQGTAPETFQSEPGTSKHLQALGQSLQAPLRWNLVNLGPKFMHEAPEMDSTKLQQHCSFQRDKRQQQWPPPASLSFLPQYELQVRDTSRKHMLINQGKLLQHPSLSNSVVFLCGFAALV